MPDVSVIIPVYNVEAWLPACLDSVLAQTLQNFEAICVNDCSPDGCADILATYAARDQRIRVISLEKNGGQGIARNVGLDAATGRYAYFLDSDDMVAPEALEELVAFADENNLDGIFFDSKGVFDSPELEQRYQSYPAMHSGTYPDETVSGLTLFESFMEQRDWTCYVQRQFWRISYLRSEGIVFPSRAPHEDEAFAFEALVKARRVRYLRKPYFLRRYRVGSVMTSKMGLRNFCSYFQGFCRISRIICDLGLESRGADRNAARLYSSLDRLYDQLVKDDVDVAAQFAGTELEDLFQFYALSKKSHLHHGLLAQEAQQCIEATDKLYIYGAGVIARDVFKSLMNQNRAVEGFLVTDVSKNPNAFQGHHVYALSDIPVDEDSLVIISVTDGYRLEIETALDALGWKHVYYKGGRH